MNLSWLSVVIQQNEFMSYSLSEPDNMPLLRQTREIGPAKTHAEHFGDSLDKVSKRCTARPTEVGYSDKLDEHRSRETRIKESKHWHKVRCSG